MSWRGHLRTVVPRLWHSLLPPELPAGRPWSTTVPDDRWGEVEIGGRLGGPPEAERLVILVHGLGGDSSGPYMARAVAAANEVGVAWLRLDLRGADGSGEDFYHAGLTADLAAAAACRELAGFRQLFALGYSLGGHVVLRWATEAPDPRLAAVAAVSTPLELRPAQRSLDRPEHWLYRAYVLRSLRRAYRAVDARRALPTPLEEVLAARTLREWDRLTVVPRWGFTDPEDYYRRASVGSRLCRLAVPALLVAGVEDPMVPPEAVRPATERAGGGLEVRWVEDGGHVSFPRGLDLGVEAPSGLEAQAVGWLLAQGAEERPRETEDDG